MLIVLTFYSSSPLTQIVNFFLILVSFSHPLLNCFQFFVLQKRKKNIVLNSKRSIPLYIRFYIRLKFFNAPLLIFADQEHFSAGPILSHLTHLLFPLAAFFALALVLLSWLLNGPHWWYSIMQTIFLLKPMSTKSFSVSWFLMDSSSSCCLSPPFVLQCYSF